MAQARTSSSSNRGASHAVLGPGTRVTGRVTGDGDLTVLGRVEGDVHLRGALVIGEGAQVVSDVHAASLEVRGALDGGVDVTGDVVVLAGAKVRGDVKGATITLDEGAELDGRIDCEFTLPGELAEAHGAEGASGKRPVARR